MACPTTTVPVPLTSLILLAVLLFSSDPNYTVNAGGGGRCASLGGTSCGACLLTKGCDWCQHDGSCFRHGTHACEAAGILSVVGGGDVSKTCRGPPLVTSAARSGHAGDIPAGANVGIIQLNEYKHKPLQQAQTPHRNETVGPANQRRLQGTFFIKHRSCGCRRCIDHGTSLKTCASFGLDCNCYTCLAAGTSIAMCASYGLDCSCHPAITKSVKCADDPYWVEAKHPTWKCGTYAPGKINFEQNSRGQNKYCTDEGANGISANKACPVSCRTCPPTCGDINKRLKKLNKECCDEPGESCRGGTPNTCNVGCAKVFDSMWKDCHKELDARFGHRLTATFGPVKTLCQATDQACRNTPCKHGGKCSGVPGNGRPGFSCACPAPYTGRTCDQCQPGYDLKTQCQQCTSRVMDPKSQCKACKAGVIFDPDKQCKQCKVKQMDPQTRCQQCTSRVMDPKQGCRICKNKLLSTVSKCKACKAGVNFDPDKQCKQCKVKEMDPQTQCQQCKAGVNFDPDKQCKQCKVKGMDPKTQCQQCTSRELDPKSQCYQCKAHGMDPKTKCKKKPPPPPLVVWPEIYRFTGTLQFTKGKYTHETILGDFKKTKVTSNGAYVYESVNRKAWGCCSPVFLYLYRDPKTGELIWVFGFTGHGKPEDVNDPDNSASKDGAWALFDSGPSAKGACALNGPASPACKWRECNGGNGGCYAYPTTGTGPFERWYGASASLKVVVGGTGGH